MKFIVLVGSLLFGAVLSQTEEAAVVESADNTVATVTQTEGNNRKLGFGGPRGGKGFSPQNFKKRQVRSTDGTDATTGTQKCEGTEKSGKGPRGGFKGFPEGKHPEGFKGFPKGGVPEGGFKGPSGGFKWSKKPAVESSTTQVPVVAQTQSV